MKKNFFLCKFWAVKNFKNLLKSAGEILLSGLRGAKNDRSRFGSLFGSFFAFFKRFSYRFTSSSGAVLFCRHAALSDRVKSSIHTVTRFSLPGNRASLSTFWGDFLAKLHRESGEKEKSTGEIHKKQKNSGDAP